jgi:predicted HicB family RNase H-like nuclease
MMASTTKKPVANLSALVATKGTAAPTKDMTTRSSAPAAAADEAKSGTSGEPLNFRVPAEFRRRFKTYAAQHDMKLNELLYKAFDAYVEK